MLFSDTIIEKHGVFLRNLIKNAPAQDVWSTASSSYGMFGCNYEINLEPNQLYYVRYTYKFTTTNQSPTWVQYYIQGGSSTIVAARIANPTAGTEYTTSGVGRMSLTGGTLTSGTVYNGNSNAISGVSSQIKNLMFYDVTELFEILRACNMATTEAALKTWCDNNLIYSPPYTNYDIREKIINTDEKVYIKKGIVIADNFIESDTMRNYSVSTTIKNNTYFDTGMPYSVYNNKGNGTVTLTRIDGKAQNSPFYPAHKYICQITTNGEASPGAGGFVASHTAGANKIFVEKFVAKVPVGYNVYAAYNSQGTGSNVTFLSSQTGTGNWAEYTILYRCGSSGSFSSGGHVYVSGSNNTNVTWYVAYVNNCEITNNEELKNFSTLSKVERIKGGNYYTNQINCLNLVSNDSKAIIGGIPSSWSYDYEDYAGNAKFSIVQPVGAAAGTVGTKIPIEPGRRYKVSYWVKCKQDMTSFLTAIRIFVNNGNTEVTHVNVAYKASTKTQLTQALNNGDTQMVVKSNANWSAYSYSKVGFRSSSGKSYNDKGTSNGYNNSTGLISGIEGSTIIKFNTAYTGSAMAKDTYVVESYDGGTYPYPVNKGALPTDNTWKYVEGYFGAKGLWDGSGGSWPNIPYDTTHIMLYINIYGNTGTVPIKYSDIKIEPISGNGRNENKIQFLGG